MVKHNIEIDMPEIKQIDLQPNTMYECRLINGESVSIFVDRKALTVTMHKQQIDDDQKTSLNVYSDRVWLSDRCKQE